MRFLQTFIDSYHPSYCLFEGMQPHPSGSLVRVQ